VGGRSAGRKSLLVATDNATVTGVTVAHPSPVSGVYPSSVFPCDDQVSHAGGGAVTQFEAVRTTGNATVTDLNQRARTALVATGQVTGWQVTAAHADGALTVRKASAESDPSNRGQVLLDAHYVAEHVQLGYAITAHRAQVVTVDTCHVVASPGSTRKRSMSP
jgi:hypothetical protein